MVRCPPSRIKLRTFHVKDEVRYRDPITRNGKSEGVRTDKTIAVQECAVVLIFMGAWIEIGRNSRVAPYGAWIEISMFRRNGSCQYVAPYMGAWIEIERLRCVRGFCRSHPVTRVRGSKRDQ